MKPNFVVSLFGSFIGFGMLLILLSAAGIVGARSSEVAQSDVSRANEVSAATPLTSTFTYQGQLKNGGSAVNGSCQMAFRLYDNPSASTNLIGSPITTTVPVTNGLFTVGLNFGNTAFDGNGRWLDINVDCGGGVIPLTPRQAVTAAPYAFYALSTGALQSYPVTTTAPSTGQVLKWNGSAWAPGVDAGGTAYSAGFGLTLIGSQFNVVTSTIQQRVTGTCSAGQYVRSIDASGNVVCGTDANSGGTITNVTAGFGLAGGGSSGSVALNVVTSTVQARVSSSCAISNAIRVVNADGSVICEAVGAGGSFWSLTGNAGTVDGTNFVGTTDNVSLTLRVNNVVGWRLAPSGTNTPNVIGGYSGNNVAPGVFGATIAGGGVSGFLNVITGTGNFATIGGGFYNTAGGPGATVGGGIGNKASGQDATIGGGLQNTASNSNATIGGGNGNTAIGDTATIGGGVGNIASGAGAFVGGGGYDGTNYSGNQAIGNASIIGGGVSNQANASYSTVGGGTGNQADGSNATVGGGNINRANGFAATVGGGDTNLANGFDATVGGGGSNQANAQNATVSGGEVNEANGFDATVGGGSSNVVTGTYGTVGGGDSNHANADWATAGGGNSNVVTGTYGTVGGGDRNLVTGIYSMIGGGRLNQANGGGATIGGGDQNQANADWATVGGGYLNAATELNATVGGGAINQAIGSYSTVGGGVSNQANGSDATVGGGYNNIASGYASTIPGGENNTATMSYTFAAGYHAQALHQGAFVWADSTGADFPSTANDQFLVRASGGARFYGGNNWDLSGTEGDWRVGNDTYRLKIGVATGGGGAGDVYIRAQGGTSRILFSTPGGMIIYSNITSTAGVQLAPGGGSWSNLSDRNVKANFTAVDGRDVLARLATVPIQTWNYQSQDVTIRHIGPMAQDFYAAFNVGEDDKHITTIDSEGVALAAIQGLYQTLQDKDAQIAQLQTRLSSLEQNQQPLSFNGFNLLSVIAFAGFAIMWLQQHRSKRGQA